MLRRLIAALALVVAVPLVAQDAVTLQRLANLGRIWGAAEYAHPWLVYRDVDFDAAAVRAIETTLAGDLDRAVDEMLSVLGDSQTRAIAPCVEPAVLPPAGIWKMLEEDIIYVQARVPVDDAVKNALRGSRAAVIDLRAGIFCAGPELPAELEPLLHGRSLMYPGTRRVLHSGYRSQETADNPFPTYSSTFTIGGMVSHTGSSTNIERVVFLVDERSRVPEVAAALQHMGRAAIVSSGPFAARLPITTKTIEGEVTAVIRTSELIDAKHRSMEPEATVTLPAIADDESVMSVALELASHTGRRFPRASIGPRLPGYIWTRDATYPEMQYPSTPYRVLAAFRLWNVIEYFYGYPHLIGDWDAQFPKILELLIAAKSQTEYELALAAAMTLVPDGHSFVTANAYYDLRGRARPPFTLMPVEGKPVVVEILDASATAAGVAPGHELLSIDGRPVQERIDALSPYISASTAAAHAYYVTTSTPNGPADSRPTFTFRKADGSTYTATLTRGSYVPPTPATPWRVLEGNIGYVDLEYLEVAQVSAMLAAMRGTRGLILDIRNYPRGVFPFLGRAMNRTGKTVTSEIRVPLVTGAEVQQLMVVQDLGKDPQASYSAPSLALIDERAQSQSEHTCLTLEAIAGTRFVGSPTVGANGNISFFSVPGNILIRFTGMDVRHADGRQLQRVGVLPDFPVPRTIGALAAGQDEVLERAVEILKNNL